MTLLQRLRDLTRSEDDLVADELRSEASRSGCEPVAEGADREVITVRGTVRSVTHRPSTKVPALVAELYDGTEAVDLVWLGRREITGVEPGRHLRATGRLCRRRGGATIYNPAYEILPTP